MDKKLEIIIINEDDEEIWLGEKMETHRKWLLHRAVSVLVLNKNWEILLQQRSLNKYHCWGMWSNAACTHPFPKESNIEAAHRRLREEMWFDTDLKEIFQFHYITHFNNWLTENEYDHVFLWYYDWKIEYNSDEVNDFKWIRIEELKNDMIENPSAYTERFKIIIDNYSSNKNSMSIQ